MVGTLTRKLRWAALGSMAAPLLLPLSLAAAEPERLPNLPAAGAVAQAEALNSLSMSQCVQIALVKQPGLAAQRASLAAAQTQYQALLDLHIPPVLGARELPVRRQQACLGVRIAEAGLAQSEWEAVYSVKRMYLATLYAREQLKVADEVVGSLRFYLARVREQVGKGESRDWTTSTVDKIAVYLGLAEVKQAEAARGIERAQAALREAMGVDPDFPFTVAPGGMPAPSVSFTREQIQQLALSQRGELVQATAAHEVVCLEIDAQATSHMLTMRTFAAGTDIHARPIPQGHMNGEYRPAAVGIEMPTLFAGGRSARMQRARDYTERAAAVVEKTRNLVALEAADVYLRWQESQRKVSQSKEAALAASRLAKNTRDDFRGDQKVKIDDVLTNEVISSQARSTYNESRYQLAIALAALERVTAGGFHADLDQTTNTESLDKGNGK